MEKLFSSFANNEVVSLRCLTQSKRVGVLKGVDVNLNLYALLAEQHAKNYYAWVHRLWAVQWDRPSGALYVCMYIYVYVCVCVCVFMNVSINI